MSRLKRVLAIALAASAILSLSACRTKDQSAFVFTDGEDSLAVRSAIYIAYMIGEDGVFQTEVQNAQVEEHSTSAANINYDRETVTNADGDGLKRNDFIKQETLQDCAEYAYVEMQFKKHGLKLDADTKANYQYYVDYYWQNTGAYYELNGISQDSFNKYFKNSYKRSELFNFYYAEGGEKEIPKKDIKAGLEDNYVLAQTITTKLTDDEGNALSNKDKKAAKKKLQGYLDDLKAGTKTFQEVYEEHNPGTTPSQTETEDPYGVLYGAEETQGASSYYSELNKMKKGNKNGKVIEFDDCYMLAVRTDILDDPFYYDTYAPEIRTILKGEEFDEFVKKEAAKLEYTTDKGVVNYYLPKRLKEPTT